MATGPARAISSGEESKRNEFDSSDCGVDVCKGVDDLAGFKP